LPSPLVIFFVLRFSPDLQDFWFHVRLPLLERVFPTSFLVVVVFHFESDLVALLSDLVEMVFIEPVGVVHVTVLSKLVVDVLVGLVFGNSRWTVLKLNLFVVIVLSVEIQDLSPVLVLWLLLLCPLLKYVSLSLLDLKENLLLYNLGNIPDPGILSPKYFTRILHEEHPSTFVVYFPLLCVDYLLLTGGSHFCLG
jgi:hypothetical protein